MEQVTTWFRSNNDIYISWLLRNLIVFKVMFMYDERIHTNATFVSLDCGLCLYQSRILTHCLRKNMVIVLSMQSHLLDAVVEDIIGSVGRRKIGKKFLFPKTLLHRGKISVTSRLPNEPKIDTREKEQRQN